MKLLFEVELDCRTPTFREDPYPEKTIASMAHAIERAISQRTYVNYVHRFTLHQFSNDELSELKPWDYPNVSTVRGTARWIGMGVE